MYGASALALVAFAPSRCPSLKPTIRLSVHEELDAGHTSPASRRTTSPASEPRAGSTALKIPRHFSPVRSGDVSSKASVRQMIVSCLRAATGPRLTRAVGLGVSVATGAGVAVAMADALGASLGDELGVEDGEPVGLAAELQAETTSAKATTARRRERTGKPSSVVIGGAVGRITERRCYARGSLPVTRGPIQRSDRWSRSEERRVGK